MKTLASWLGIMTFALCACGAEPELVWEATGFRGPESVVFDRARGEYYVSNMGSYGPGAKAGDGFISRVSRDGRLLELEWVTGFQDPKGLALANGRLYVGDTDALVEVDPSRGKIVARHAPPDGPGDFNDCTADGDGNVYVCSGRLGTVFRLHAGQLEPWFKLDRSQTGSPNGLLAEKDRLLLGGWSLKLPDGKEQLGHISTVRYADKTLGRLGSKPVCHVDGLEPDGSGGYTVTDWMTGDVLQVTADGQTQPLMKLSPGSADHTYLISERLLVIPLMKDHVLRAYRWVPAAAATP